MSLGVDFGARFSPVSNHCQPGAKLETLPLPETNKQSLLDRQWLGLQKVETGIVLLFKANSEAWTAGGKVRGKAE